MSQCLTRPADGAEDAHVSAATAQVLGQRLLDFRFAWVLMVSQKCGGFHNHAANTKTTLCGLLRDKGFLYGCELAGWATQSLEGYNLSLADCRKRRNAGAYRGTIQVHRASTALAQPAAEARRVQSQVVAQGVEERHVGIIDRQALGLAINMQ